MKVHSDKAWAIASKFSGVLASETRDLAALIDEAYPPAPTPTGDVGELVKQLRTLAANCRTEGFDDHADLMSSAADMLVSSNSRLEQHVEHRDRQLRQMTAAFEASEQALRSAREALAPFAALIDRRWTDKAESIECVRKGGFISELQAVELKHVLAASAALTGAGEEGE